jgi:hypothetical protein
MIMSDPVYHGGGFGGALRERMSDELQIRLEAAESLELEADVRAERERALRAERFQEQSIQAAIAQAVANGERVNPRQAMQGRGIGHQPHVFIQQRAALMEREDLEAEAADRRAFEQWKRDRGLAGQADMTAPTTEEVEQAAERRAHTEHYLDRARQRKMAVREARELAAQDAARADRQVLGRVAAAAATAFGSEAGYQIEYRGY